MNKTPLIIIVLLVLIIAGMAYFMFSNTAQAPVVENTTPTSTPTTTPHEQEEPALHDKVFLTSPKEGSSVGKSFTVAGEAPGNWYFEASFPIQVRDRDGNVIARTHANAQSDWMTTAQVPFTSSITIDGPYTGPALLILMKDNPSGLPENEDAKEFDIVIQ